MSDQLPEPPADPAPDPERGAQSGLALTVLIVVVVAVLSAPVVLAVVHAAVGGGAASDTPDTATAPSRAVPAPSGTSSGKSSGTSSAPRRSVTCWDGSNAAKVAACSEPAGADGLAWVFPAIPDQRCGTATSSGPDGVVLRQICRARIGGGRALVVYSQWQTTARAEAYLRLKGLQPAPGRGASKVRRFTSTSDELKVGAVYADEPFSYIVTLPAGADPATVAQVVRERPATQVRGSRERAH